MGHFAIPISSTFELQDTVAMEPVSMTSGAHTSGNNSTGGNTLETGASLPPARAFNAATANAPGRFRKVLIAALITAANLVQMTSNGVGITASLIIGRQLGIDGGPSDSNWIAASYSLTQGTFVLIAGRLGAVCGHEKVLLFGMSWLVIFTLASGFCRSYIAFSAVRAVSGIGGALIMPNGMAILSIAIPPGKVRNTCISLFVAAAPLGAWSGSLLAGLLVDWRWIFWLL